MTPLRKLVIGLTAVGCVALAGCGSGSGDSSVASALPPAPTTTSTSPPPSTSDSASPSPSPSIPPALPAPEGEDGQPPASTDALGNPAPAPKPGDPAPQPGAPAPQPGAAQPGAAQPNPGLPDGGASLPSDGDPAKALADAGPAGQDYLGALREQGIIMKPGIEGIYVLFAQATCKAKANGTPRAEILKQLSQIGPMLAPGTAKSPDQIADVFVSAAEKYIC